MRGAIVGSIGLGLVLIALFLGLVYLPSNPEPARHYDAETGVMCYTIPRAISCVKVP